jgi:hypothetical protein
MNYKKSWNLKSKKLQRSEDTSRASPLSVYSQKTTFGCLTSGRSKSPLSLHIAHVNKRNISFSSSGVWTLGLTLAGQVLYHLNHIPNPFCFGYYFWLLFFLCPGRPGPRSSHLGIPCTWGDRLTPPCPPFYWLRWGAPNVLTRLALYHGPPGLHLPSS